MTGSAQAWRAITLPDSLQAPAVARRWLLNGIAGAPADLVDTAVLLVSELVTNAVLYGEPEVTARMRNADGAIEVVVTDSGEVIPMAPDGKRPDPRQPAGRGLFIVVELASDGDRPAASRSGQGSVVPSAPVGLSTGHIAARGAQDRLPAILPRHHGPFVPTPALAGLTR